jgi:acid phosphatase
MSNASWKTWVVMRCLRLGLLVVGPALAGCMAASVPPATSPPSAPAAASPASAPAPVYSASVTWVQRSAEYQAIVAQTYRQAQTAVESASRGKPSGSWAVILDADETVISNLAYQQALERAGETHTAARFGAWARRREAVPLPGAQAFLDRVRRLGGRIAIVTNRLGSECDDTRAVFDRHQLAYDVMLCRADGTPSDKNPRFATVASGTWPGASGPLEILAWVGDNILDFPGLTQAVRREGESAYGAFGTRFFMLPNPMYGSWE